MKFRLSIDTGPSGLSGELLGAFQADGFELLANLERDWVATRAGEELPTPGRRYIYLVDARDAAQTETRARAIVGPDSKIRVTPHGGRVTE